MPIDDGCERRAREAEPVERRRGASRSAARPAAARATRRATARRRRAPYGLIERRRDGDAAERDERDGVPRSTRPSRAGLTGASTRRARHQPSRASAPTSASPATGQSVTAGLSGGGGIAEPRGKTPARRAEPDGEARPRARPRGGSAAPARRPACGRRRRRVRAKRSIAPTRNGTSATMKTSSIAQPRTIRLPR